MSIGSWWENTKAEWQTRKQLKKKYFQLSKAIEAKDPDAVETLLDGGAHPNFNPDSLRFPWPAQLALESGDTDIFKHLLDHGMNPNFIFREDETHHWAWQSLLYVAIDRGQEDIAMQLLQHPKLDFQRSGMAVSIESATHYPTPLELARKKGMDRVVRVLAKRDAALKREQADELDVEVKDTARRLAQRRLGYT